jgi:hypothetical protein
MPDYQNGKIYKLINTESTLTYIGSTTQTLAQRKAKHHENYKCWKKGKTNYVTSFKIFDNDEWGCQIVLIENFPCNSRDELERQERYYIESIECVNKNRPTRTRTEWKQDNKEKIMIYQNDYRKDNIIKISEKRKVKHDCVCGGKYTFANKSQHLKTSRHQDYMNLNNL